MGYAGNSAAVAVGNYVGQAQAIGGAPMPISPMLEAREMMQKTLSNLHERIENLERRIDPICAPATPTPAAPDARALNQAITSETRSFLNDQTRVISGAIDRLDSLLSRLEL